jgi:outer membrane protein assembly factor BamB
MVVELSAAVPRYAVGQYCAICSLLVGLLLFAGPASASDWPQLLGSNRDGATEEVLHAEWGEKGPDMVWQAEVGNGFAGVAVAGDRAIGFVREGDEEIVRCYAAHSGKVLWESGSPCEYQGGVSGDKGPRCVPLISSDRVFTFGVEGILRCLSLVDGKELWNRDTTKDFKPLEGYFGVGSTPVLYKDRLIVNVGGRDKASVVAFDIADGKTVWSTFTDAASYSAPVIMKVDKTDLAVVVTRLHVVGIDPVSGELQFMIPFGARGPTVNGATPVVLGNQIFLSASYNIGSLLIEVDPTGAREVWRDENLLATQYATPVAMSKGSSILFAVDGRQDAGSQSSSLKCIDVKTQKVLWEESGFDYGSLIRVKDQLLILTCGGELIRAAASKDRYQEISRSQVLKPTSSGYRLPALSNGRLYIRDEATLKCLNVGPVSR